MIPNWSISQRPRRLGGVVTAVVLLVGSLTLIVPSLLQRASAQGCTPGSIYSTPGAVILPGSCWMGGQGVDVKSDGGSGQGGYWQCVELVTRLYDTKGWGSGSWPYANGDQIWATHRPGLTSQAQGSITYLNPGDAVSMEVIQPNGSPEYGGHVAVVSSVSGAQVTLVQQNAVSVVTTATFSSGRITFPGAGGWSYPVNGVLHAPATSSTTSSPSSPVSASVINADFGNGTQGWQVVPNTNTNFVTYGGGQTSWPPYSGARYASTNTNTSGGGFYQDIPVNTEPNETTCATAMVRTSNGGTGAGGVFNIFQLGGSYNDSEGIGLGSLGSTWQQVETCSVATTSHNFVRVQFYPAVNQPTLDVDDVNVTQDMAVNGDFGSGGQGWTVAPGTNFVTYGGGQTSWPPYSGARYASTNTNTSGGGFYQDIPVNTEPNETICATAMVRTSNGGTGAGGVFNIFQLGGSYNDSEGIGLGSLGSTWQQVETCSVATTSHNFVRVQFYPAVNQPTLDVDDVNVHVSAG